MKTNILATAVALSDGDLLTRIFTLARTERETVAELLAHLTALELRPSLYAEQGYGSLFDYCTSALGLSEDAACSRINAIRTCKRFPVILDRLAAGDLTLTAVRLLSPHLTPENHEAVLARARNKRQGEIQALIAELAPRPDVASSLRKLPVPKATPSLPAREAPASVAVRTEVPSGPDASPAPPSATLDKHGAAEDGFRLQYPRPHSPNHRPIVEPLAPRRYRVQFTIGQEAHDDLRAVQALLRREIPNGDPGVIFERALAVFRREVEKAKLGVGTRSRRRAGEARSRGRTYENRIRLKTDKASMRDALPGNEQGDAVRSEAVGSAPSETWAREVPREAQTTRTPSEGPYEVKTTSARHERPASRHIPNAVKAAVWYRDRGQCAFVSATGRRCAERNFLELHHVHPYALDGPPTVGNIALRCRRHNQYEAELIFGPRGVSTARETRASYQSGSVTR